jgi:ATP-dependent DNA helicase RecG
MMRCDAITAVKGVGKKTAESLAKLHIHKVQDLLFHLPFRYEDRTKITAIKDARAGDRILIEGDVEKVTVMGRKKLQMICQVSDETGTMTLRFFHFNGDQLKRLKEETQRIRCFGEVREGLYRQLEMSHPEYQAINHITERLQLSDRLTPIYPTTQGVGQNILRRLVGEALGWLDQNSLKELLPQELLDRHQLVSIHEALHYIHEPPTDANQQQLQTGTHPMQQRLAFEELLAHQLNLYTLRQKKRAEAAHPMPVKGVYKQKILEYLPFALTGAQLRVLADIEKDLQQPYPMMRLVQGDVGSGKTLVAALAAFHAIESGFQVAIMAPTEILAEQHWKNFKAWCDHLSINVGLLIGSQTAKVKESELQNLANGHTQLIIGTHALFQKDVLFKNLGLIVIDEQHRFGVHQRMALSDKGAFGDHSPHQLVMTATPIPRTLSMTAYADLDSSIIDELPPGRTPVETILISSQRRDEIIERVRANCEAGRQAYWVCTLIDESEALACQAAENTADLLKQVLLNLNVGLVHGRMKSKEKDAIMQQFKIGELHLLVATTVIEVGVDVPNSSLMIIENPERLGLAQLHQLRGRVGRGSAASYCVLLYNAPLSGQADQRLRIMRESCDGFYIAEEDLKLRGPGELLGTRQSGLMNFKVADLLRDQALIETVKNVGKDLIQTAPAIAEGIIDRWLGYQLRYMDA